MEVSALTIQNHLAEKIKDFRPHQVSEDYLYYKYVFKYIILHYVPKANYSEVINDLAKILAQGTKPLSNRMVEKILNIEFDGKDFMTDDRLKLMCQYFKIKKGNAFTSEAKAA